MKRKRTVLLISSLFPLRKGAMGTGSYRRLQLMVLALRELSEQVNALFFVSHDHPDVSSDYAHRVSCELSELWRLTVSATLCRRAAPAESGSLFKQYILRSAHFRSLPDYHHFAADAQLSAIKTCLEAEPDLILARRLGCMVPLLGLKDHIHLPPVFFDLDDIEHIAYRRSIVQPPRWRSKKLAYLHLPALMYCEYQSLRLSNRTFVCSPLDKRRLERLFRIESIETIPNAVDLPARSTPCVDPNVLLIASYGYAPNRLGAEYFLDQVWPNIKARVPAATAILAGPKPDLIRHYTDPPRGVRFTGFVDDLGALYAQTRVAVCPILSGGGTRVKIIEAAAYTRPVVSTSLGAEGLAFADGRSIALRDDPDSFADACVSFLMDPASCASYGDAARELVKSKYHRDVVARTLAERIDSVTATGSQ